MSLNPATSVFPREEYYYKDKDRLLAPKLDSGVRYGSYGMITIEVIWYYPIIPGQLFHPVENADEASWWLNYYQHDGNVKKAYFVPSPDQTSVGTFTPPVIPPNASPVAPQNWVDQTLEAGPYNFGNDGHTF